ncbi:recombinase family protein [Rhabdobacter roseus]|jgi:DNA invertase Pin-like site-specific DNA recombinase|uniref:DNA invertase Pin-like site-specific DNA recombinase n=2 Tax=Rhabdobacter roseus TaxID=1655419 RepID=A0A840U5I1_9BACT|nr:DNA invertase Pin-like site-specific DNA recombinase [Rhabdobacter roseus]
MDALAKAGCNIIFQEKASGVKTYRPDLEKMLSQLWKGDMLCIYKLDGSGRTATRQALKNLLELVAGFESRGVGLKSLTDSIDTTTPQGRLVLNIFGSPASSIAQQRDLIRERIKAGLEVVRGRKDGRKRGLSSEAQKKAMLAEVYYKDGKLGVDKIVKSVGVSKMTFDKHLHLR